ncbi:LamG domain-containing protein [Blastopirellula retiformator]|uniref:LamG-like jellyroll fold domain-containing protein n=1 Tax=Blastopirellula retiformator TaxID=2527970 RepID=A0A5C5V0W6_9BACT|nr:LamG domain-containing protein [Blastopirellula retiformator]TWT31382.1 hypothetical protein Enr8_33030 [Blastopirellula retiformator]
MSPHPRQRRPASQRRSGIAVVVVLALLSITLAMSYAMMRTQMNASQIERNLHRTGSARHAAHSALAIGVRKMHSGNWQGVGVPLTGSLSDVESYIVTYEAGDAQLTPADPDWQEYPYRITVKATGIAFDPLDPTYKSEYQAEAVVQLVRKQRNDNPAHFTSAQTYTTYLWGTQSNSIEMPVSINGPAHIQGPLDLCTAMPATERPFHGLVDEVAIFDHPISNLSLLFMYLNGNGNNSTMQSQISNQSPSYWWRFNESSSSSATTAPQVGGRTGTYHGGTLPGVTVSGANRAAYFDGESGHLDLGKFELPAGGQFTILAWIAPMSGDSTNEWARIISKATGTSASDHSFMFGFQKGNTNSARLRTHITFGNSAYTNVAAGGDVIPGYWSMVAITYDGSALRFYKNGVYISGYSISGAPGTDPNAKVWIGDNPPGAARTRFLGDLLKMQTAGQGDYRPFTGDIRLNSATNPNSHWLTLSRMLGLNVNFANHSVTSPSEITADAETYQLFPGGKTYTVPSINGNIRDVSFVPSMTDNPLGVLRVQGALDVGDDVTIEGLIITPTANTDIHLSGDGIKLTATTLPAVIGDTTPWELPVIYSRDDVIVDDAQAVVEGAVIAHDQFEIDQGKDDAKFLLSGMLHAQRTAIGTRESWDQFQNKWDDQLDNFVDDTGADADDYFPQWLDDEEDLPLDKNLSISPPAEPKSYYWPDLSRPLYLADPKDAGLVWKYVRRSAGGGG